MADNPPLTDDVIVALALLVDDSQTEKRDPTHYDLDVLFAQYHLSGGEQQVPGGRPVGKAKRIRGALNWAMINNQKSGEAFVSALISNVQGKGGFRSQSSNYCGSEAIANLVATIANNGWDLSTEGNLAPRVLEAMKGRELTAALAAYADRARRGALDSPLLAGIAKDLLEATAAHVLVEKWGNYPSHSNFPTLLGQAFTALDFATPMNPAEKDEPVKKRVERAAYDLGCALNALRNKEGTGHGRPWLSTVTRSQSRFAIESMGNIASLMLDHL
ncbi:abortive infection family protein [Pseudomonas sp. B21-010]|uniref:abortive infection family protein n=1 Tax=Pseudomonas sp. B21-010 TaxID=2895471 RepID=UPI00215EE5BE|nr:abortive infection family protein [Pseudomonas sp. B21-010]UVM59118.1 abortive infection family protein [Pseudomonas sp. B21-010]